MKGFKWSLKASLVITIKAEFFFFIRRTLSIIYNIFQNTASIFLKKKELGSFFQNTRINKRIIYFNMFSLCSICFLRYFRFYILRCVNFHFCSKLKWHSHALSIKRTRDHPFHKNEVVKRVVTEICLRGDPSQERFLSLPC